MRKKLYEEINFLYYTSYTKLEEAKKELLVELEKERLTKEIAEKQDEKQDEINEQEQNSLASEVNELDDKYYYNENLEAFTLNLAFIDWDEQLYETSNYIENTLKEIWIKVNKTPINLSQVQNFIEDEKSYDMILSWINLWYFYYNLFPYLHSSQAQSWYNFSKIRKTSLDILLEELKSDVLNTTRISEIEEKLLKFFKKNKSWKLYIHQKLVCL